MSARPAMRGTQQMDLPRNICFLVSQTPWRGGRKAGDRQTKENVREGGKPSQERRSGRHESSVEGHGHGESERVPCQTRLMEVLVHPDLGHVVGSSGHRVRTWESFIEAPQCRAANLHQHLHTQACTLVAERGYPGGCRTRPKKRGPSSRGGRGAVKRKRRDEEETQRSQEGAGRRSQESRAQETVANRPLQ